MEISSRKRLLVIKRALSFIVAFVMVLSLLGNDTTLSADEAGGQEKVTSEQPDVAESSVADGGGTGAVPQALLISPRNTNVRVADLLPSSNSEMIAVIRIADSTFTTYSFTADGLREALFYMYQNGSGAGDDYILYIGGTANQTLDLSAPNHVSMVAAVIPAVPEVSNITFFALQDKIGTLVITGDFNDPLDEHTTAPSGARCINVGGWNDWHLGTDTILRNIRYSGRSLYGNGHHLTLGYGSYHEGTMNIYGGGPSGIVTGDVVLDVYSTGNNDVNIVGGNYSGTLAGNITTTIYNSSNNRLNFFGGGRGTGNTNRAAVNGNVTNEIKKIGGTLGGYYGAGEFVNVTGTVRNTISGTGSNGGVTAEGGYKFIGGAKCGDIGSDRNQDAIVNYVDFRLYTRTGYWKNFTGANGNSSLGPNAGAANQSEGIIQGNITNVVSAGDYDTGGEIAGVTGGGDYNTIIDAGDRYNGFDHAADAKAAAKFQVYGNIHTTLTGGCYARTDIVHYARSAGFGGYIEGNTTIEVGTESLAYGQQKPTGDIYKVNLGGRNGYGLANNFWDIVGGGGEISQGRNIYIKGDTKLVQHNSLARWTYGGSFGGTIEGNTTNELLGGRVHTLEGAGYDGYLVKGGTSHAIVRSGQVDWFLSGGGWNDRRIENNVKVTVESGIINAHVGGTYGLVESNVVTGDCEINIYGGDFRGWAHDAPNNPNPPKVVAGGPSYQGRLEGNITVNIDYSRNPDPNAKFELPAGCYISGGTPYGSLPGQVKVGAKNKETSITVNIKAGGIGNTDALAGASIYGDGGEQSSLYYNAFNSISTGMSDTPMCYAKKITMNIETPGSSIGQLYATNSKNMLQRDVEINVLSAKSIDGINGGSGRGAVGSDSFDDYTNGVVSSAGAFGGVPNRSKISIGKREQSSFLVNIGSGGIKNFTELTIDNAIFFADGIVVNGAGVENNNVETRIQNHGTTYSQFGDIVLRNNAGFGIGLNSYAVGRKLNVEGQESIITSPSGRGRFIITDYLAESSRIVWNRSGGDNTYQHQGTWFGVNQYYRVFTFSPQASYANAAHITPTGLRGVEQGTFKTYIGDNTTSDGYGLALPGSFIEYNVAEPKGHITHNVQNVSDGSGGLPITAYGTWGADVPAQSGVLAIPAFAPITPTLTFTPAMKEQEPNIPEYWVKKVVVKASDDSMGSSSHSSEIGESSDYGAKSWTSPNGEYSYLIDAFYTNAAGVLGKSILITEGEAQALTDSSKLIELMEASGRPFFDHNIDTDQILTAIKVPLAADEYARKHEVTYKAGVSTTPNSVSIIRNVILVKNGTELSPDRSVGLYAQDASIFLEDANELADQAALDTGYTKAIAIETDGLTYGATITNDAFQTIKNATSLQSVPVHYSYTGSGSAPQTVNKNVNVEIVKTTVPFQFVKIDAADYRTVPSLITPLAGAEFTLAKLVNGVESVPINSTSGVDGTVDFGLLEAGEYVLREITAPAGGYVLPKGYWKLTVTPRDPDPANKVVIKTYTQFDEIRAEGVLIPGDFVLAENGFLLPNEKGTDFGLVKVDADTLSGIPFALFGASFELFGISPNGTEQKIDQVQSDIMGNVRFGRLADGTYRIRETAAPNGYDTPGGSWTLTVDNSNTAAPFTVGKEGADQPDLVPQSGRYLVPNAKSRLSFQLQKIDLDTIGSTAPGYLQDARFSLYRLTTNSSGQEEKVLLDDTLTSAADGMVSFQLVSGTYILVETAAPAGYVTPTGYWKIEIDATKPSIADGSVKITAYSTDGRIQKDPLPNEDPLIPVRQDPGIPPRAIYLGGGTQTFFLPNEKGVQFDFVKADEVSLGQASPVVLAGAEFKLFALIPDSNGTEQKILYQTLTSGADGKIDFGFLPVGTYRLEETAAPTDYKKPSGYWKLTVNLPTASPAAPYEGIVITNVAGTDQVEPPGFVQKQINAGTNVSYVLANVRSGTDFSFTKVNDQIRDTNGTLLSLRGAQFKLYAASGTVLPAALVTDASIAAGDWTLIDEQTTGENGVVTYSKLEDGYYMLVETKAPLGYETPYGQWLITTRKNEAEPLTIAAKERDGAGLPPAFQVENTGGAKSYLLPNFKQFVLPFSGNVGVYGFIGTGLLLILISVLAWQKKRKIH